MKIVVVGASGTIGKAVVEKLKPRHEIVTAGRTSGDINIDVTDAGSIRAAYEKIGSFDAMVSTLGKVKFAPLADMQAEDYEIGIKDKLMGQVNLVLIGREFITDKGSFTLSTGVLDHDPIAMGNSASMVNGALNAFAMAAAIELPRGLRINTVSASVIEEALEGYGPFFRGFEAVPAAKAARAFSKSVEGLRTGHVFEVL